MPQHPARPKFGTVVTRVMRDPSLSMSAKALYCLLCTYADGERSCWPSNETLGEQLGVTDRSIRTLMNELVTAGIVMREARYVEGRQSTSVTHLVDVTSDREEVEFPPEEEALFPPEGEADFLQNKTSKNKTRGTSSSSPSATPHGFESWWSLYPRKVGKPEALRAYTRAVEKEAPDVIIAALRQQVGQLGKDLKFCPHPSTWLNQERWADTTEPPAPEKKPYVPTINRSIR
jgi:Helix-turn-helix domain